MSEGPIKEIEKVPSTVKNMPWLAIGIGFGFLVLVLIVESFKPGLLTGPIRAMLVKLGLKGA
jgi:hypothetical protein